MHAGLLFSFPKSGLKSIVGLRFVTHVSDGCAAGKVLFLSRVFAVFPKDRLLHENLDVVAMPMNELLSEANRPGNAFPGNTDSAHL